MTPIEFKAAYEVYACHVTDQIGLDPSVVAAQWALETAWGSSMPQNNLAGIRCGPNGALPFCTYATLDEFVTAYVVTLNNGDYGGVLASTGQPVGVQMTALGESPWSGTHYGSPPGSNLIPYQEALQMPTIDELYALTLIIHQGMFDGDPAVLPGPSMQHKIDDTWNAIKAGGAIQVELAAIKTEISNLSGSGGLTATQAAQLADIQNRVIALQDKLGNLTLKAQ